MTIYIIFIFESIKFFFIIIIMNNNNNYTLVDFPEDNKYYGKFTGKYPKTAANEAFSTLIQFTELKENEFIVFVIKNINTNKMYKYIGGRVKLENPVKINGKTVEYKNIIGKYNSELNKI